MPSFVCDYCQETLKKAKLDQHTQRCRNASFSCIDCYKTFKGTEYRAHTSCITEVQKYHVKTTTPPPTPAKSIALVPEKPLSPLVALLKEEKKALPMGVLKKKAKKSSKEAKKELKRLIKERLHISLDSNNQIQIQLK